MAILSKAAQKLLSYLGIYKLTSAQYKSKLAKHPGAHAHGAFSAALAELYAGGY